MTWAEKLVRMNENIGAADAFMGNVHKGGYEDDVDMIDGGSSSSTTTPTTTFDDDEMDEDGYWGMFGTRGRKKRGFMANLVQMMKVPYRALFGEYKRVAPGTLILVRHGESE